MCNMKSSAASSRQARRIILKLFLVARAISGGPAAAVDAFTPQLPRTDARLPTTRPNDASSIRKGHRRYFPARSRPLWMIENGGSDQPSKLRSLIESKYLLPVIAVVSLSLVTVAALTHRLPGPPIDATAPQPPFLATLPFGVVFSGSCDPYSPSLVLRDFSATVFSILASAAFVKSITYPTKLGKIDPRDARKLIHTFSAPLFLFVWPLFSHAYGARVFAAIVPLLNAVRLFVAGTAAPPKTTGASSLEFEASATEGREAELARAVSRSGDVGEALRGPSVYVAVLLFCTLVLWADTPVGVVSVATMAAGDGLADLMGRRFGSDNRWPFRQNKSAAGSAAFVVGSVAASFGLISWLAWTGTMDPLPYDSLDLLQRLLVVAVVCAGVELLPVMDDNYSVPIAAGVLSAYLLNH